MAESELTTFQISKSTLAKIKELAEVDKRSGTKEIEWLVDEEIERRKNPQLEAYRAKFSRAPKGE
jgi:hypothetical protein